MKAAMRKGWWIKSRGMGSVDGMRRVRRAAQCDDERPGNGTESGGSDEGERRKRGSRHKVCQARVSKPVDSPV